MVWTGDLKAEETDLMELCPCLNRKKHNWIAAQIEAVVSRAS